MFGYTCVDNWKLKVVYFLITTFRDFNELQIKLINFKLELKSNKNKLQHPHKK